MVAQAGGAERAVPGGVAWRGASFEDAPFFETRNDEEK